jgi:hypothetical protein
MKATDSDFLFDEIAFWNGSFLESDAEDPALAKRKASSV